MSKKRILAMLLSFVMMLSLCIPVSVSAEESNTVTEDSMRDYLITVGCPEEYVDTLPAEKIANMFQILQSGNYVFSGWKEEVLEVQEENQDARGNIPTSKLQLTIATFDNTHDGNIVNDVYVSLGYRWLQTPFACYTDALTFNWDGSLFSLNGFYALNTGSNGAVVSSITAPAKSANGGIGWYSLMADYNFGTIGTNGGAELRLVPKRTITMNSNLNSDMHLNYAHSTLGLSLSFGIDGSGASAGVSIVDGVYDELATYYVYH